MCDKVGLECLKAVSIERLCHWNWWLNFSGSKVSLKLLCLKTVPLIFGILKKKKKKKSYESLWRYNLHSRAASSSQNLPRMKHQTVQRPSSKTSPGGTAELKSSTKESPKQVQMCFILAALQLKSMWFYFEQL